MDSDSTLVPLGVIIGAHGIGGGLRVKLLNPASDLLASLAQVWLRAPGEAAARRVELRKAHPHRLGISLVSIDGCSDRDAADALRGTELCVPRTQLPALDAGEYYLVDLVGLEVRLPDGKRVGVVQDAIEYPASQVLRVRLAQAGESVGEDAHALRADALAGMPTGPRASMPGAGMGVGLGAGIIEIPLFAPYLVEIQLDRRAVIVDQLQDLEIEPARDPRPK